MTMEFVGTEVELADDEFAADEIDGTPACAERTNLADAEIAEIIRIPWQRSLELDVAPLPVASCSHERGHPGSHIARMTEAGGGDLVLWFLWREGVRRVAPGGYCGHAGPAGIGCGHPEGHEGRHRICFI